MIATIFLFPLQPAFLLYGLVIPFSRPVHLGDPPCFSALLELFHLQLLPEANTSHDAAPGLSETRSVQKPRPVVLSHQREYFGTGTEHTVLVALTLDPLTTPREQAHTSAPFHCSLPREGFVSVLGLEKTHSLLV